MKTYRKKVAVFIEEAGFFMVLQGLRDYCLDKAEDQSTPEDVIHLWKDRIKRLWKIQ